MSTNLYEDRYGFDLHLTDCACSIEWSLLFIASQSPIMSDDPPALDEMTFEQALQRLEEIVASLEDETPELEQALSSYEEGTALAQHCLEQLEQAELRVDELSLDP
jgi:exodeoxyribonuclease VII small subunit